MRSGWLEKQKTVGTYWEPTLQVGAYTVDPRFSALQKYLPVDVLTWLGAYTLGADTLGAYTTRVLGAYTTRGLHSLRSLCRSNRAWAELIMAICSHV